MHDVLPLDLLETGEWAEVAELSGEAGWVGRMAELGLQTGSRLQVLRSGTPCLLRVGNTRLSLRGEGAAQIFVRPVAIDD